MLIEVLKSKIHRATITDADLNYEGSISIDVKLMKQANLFEFEKVDIYNNNSNTSELRTYENQIKNNLTEAAVDKIVFKLAHTK